jgi:hypothetical protein
LKDEVQISKLSDDETEKLKLFRNFWFQTNLLMCNGSYVMLAIHYHATRVHEKMKEMSQSGVGGCLEWVTCQCII